MEAKGRRPKSLTPRTAALKPLPVEEGLYYRTHHKDAPFGREHAFTKNIGEAPSPEMAKYWEPKPGYSAFWHPHHLKQYHDEMGWSDDMKDRRVLAFRGTPVGSGADGEPAVMPHGDRPETSMSWGQFRKRLEVTSEPSTRWDDHTWGEGPNGQMTDDGYRTIGVLSPRTAAADEKLYHGTRHHLDPGDILEGGARPANNPGVSKYEHVYMARTPMAAHAAGSLAYDAHGHQRGQVNVYEVEPLDPAENDPFTSGAVRSRRARVVRQVDPVNPPCRRCGNPLDDEDIEFGASERLGCETSQHTAAADGPWYHGTRQVFQPGDLVTGNHEPINDPYSHFAAHPEFAATYGPNVYEVKPTGEHEEDPYEDDSRRSLHPLRVIRSWDVPDEIKAELSEHGYEYHKTAKSWLPSSGIFGPTSGLDPRLFGEDSRLRPAVRGAVMEKLDRCLRTDSGLAGSDWQEWLHVYLLGGSASEWAGARPNDEAQDLDVVVLLDFPGARENSSFGGMSRDGAVAALNRVFRMRFNETGWRPDCGGIWDVTAYCNTAASIGDIRPYAAWDLTAGRWAVRPPHLPDHSLADFDPAILAHARAVLAEARAVLRMPEPLRTREARSLWEHVHEHRCQAFSAEGTGWDDPGNLDEKWLAYAPGNVMGKIRELAYADTASLDKVSGMTATAAANIRFDRDYHGRHRVSMWPQGYAGSAEYATPLGSLHWHPENGMITVLQIASGQHGKGIATALWNRAHEEAARHQIAAPVHSPSRTPAADAWAHAVGGHIPPLQEDCKDPEWIAGLGPDAQLRPRTAGREEQLAAQDPASRASSLAQEHVRLFHPRLMYPVDFRNGQNEPTLTRWLSVGGHPRAGDAYIARHPSPDHGVSCTGRGPDGEPAVILHPDRCDYGTLAHEAAHLIADHETGRQPGGEHGPSGAHDDRWAGHYARLLNDLSPEAGDDFLAQRGGYLDRPPNEKTASWDSSGSEKSGVYLRFGDWPADEQSYNGALGRHEDGVSVYELDDHGEPRDPDPGWKRGLHEHGEHCGEDCDVPRFDPDYGNDTGEEMSGRVSRAEKNRRTGEDVRGQTGHLVTGDVVGFGHDDEPLLHNVRRVGDWIDHRHLFIPGAEPHRLARDPSDEDYEKPVLPRQRREAAADPGASDYPGLGILHEGSAPADVSYSYIPGSGSSAHAIVAHPPGAEPVKANRIGRLSWVSDSIGHRIVNVWVDPARRRHGIATEMLRRAREIAPGIRHAPNPTEDGRDWISGMEQKTASARRQPWMDWAADRPHQAVIHHAQQALEQDHPELMQPLGEPDWNGFSQRGGELLKRSLLAGGYPPGKVERSFVMEHEHPEWNTSQVAMIGDRIGAAVHPGRWYPRTVAHEAGHILHLHSVGLDPREKVPDGIKHGPEFARHYATALNAISVGSGDDFVRHHADAMTLVGNFRHRVLGLPREFDGSGLEREAVKVRESLPPRQAKMPRPDYDPSEELPEGRGIFYRAHDMRRPLDAAHARSAPLNHGYRPLQVDPMFSVGQRGYSSFASPHELSSYIDEMEWKERNDWKHREAIAFHGKHVGIGEDNEPLVVPEANPHCCGRVIHKRMPWDEFEGRLWHGDYADPDSHKYHDHQELWRENNEDDELDERRFKHTNWRSPEVRSERRYREKKERRREAVKGYDLPAHLEQLHGWIVHPGHDLGHEHAWDHRQGPPEVPHEHEPGSIDHPLAGVEPPTHSEVLRASRSGPRDMPVAEALKLRSGDWGGSVGDHLDDIREKISSDYEDDGDELRRKMSAGVLPGGPLVVNHGQLDDGHRRLWMAHHLGWPSVQVRSGDWSPRKAVKGYDLKPRSAMIYLDFPEGLIKGVRGGTDDHHITVVYLGKDVGDEAFAEACRRAEKAAAATPPLKGVLRGIESFPPSDASDGKIPAFVPAYIPGIGKLRELLEDLNASQFTDYRPHCTLAYLEPGDRMPEPHPAVHVSFARLHVKRGDEVVSYPLGGGRKTAEKKTLYHGSKQEMNPGDQVTPDHPSATSKGTSGWVYATPHATIAYNVAQYKPHPGRPRVYEVEPVGSLRNDPEMGPGESFRSREPLKVIRELSKNDIHSAMSRRWGPEAADREFPELDQNAKQEKMAARQPAFYHGTSRGFQPGDLVVPGNKVRAPGEANYPAGNVDPEMNHVYVSTSRVEAYSHGENSSIVHYDRHDEEVPPRVYQVRPTGPVSVDPEDEGMERPRSWRSEHPMKVIREVTPQARSEYVDSGGEPLW